MSNDNSETSISLTTDSSSIQETTSVSMIKNIQSSTSTKIASNHSTIPRTFEFVYFRPSLIRRNHTKF